MGRHQYLDLDSRRLYSTDDNPLLLANRKAKKLKALPAQKALHGQRLPYVEPIIFLSAPLRCDLSGVACTGVYMRQESERRAISTSWRC